MSCEKCDGAGWRYVQAKYAERAADTKVPTGEDGARDERAWKVAYDVALAMVYPCKDCQPDRFWRWVNGHLDREHDRASCAECITLGVSGSKRRHAGRSTRARDTPPPPTEPPEDRPVYDDLETAQ